MATNFPSGLASRGIPLPSGGELLSKGDVIHVDSGHDNASTTNPGTLNYPMSTIDAAINATTANNGDIILVTEGHSETIANATSLVPDVAGVKIFGLGRGADRPTITFSAAAATIPISAASVEFHNFLFTVSGTTDVTAGITVTGADAVIKDCEFREASGTAQFVDGILVSNVAADRILIDAMKFFGAAGDATNSAISFTAVVTHAQILNLWAIGTFAEGGIDTVDVACTDLLIERPYIQQEHATQDECISLSGTATGYIVEPRLRTATNDANGFNVAITATNDMQIYDPLVVNLDGERGGAWGTASAA